MMRKETLNSYLEVQMNKYPENLAIIYPEGNVTYTYKEMSQRIDLLAKGLIANGVKKETHVSILAQSCPDWFLYYFALTKIGAIPVCLNDKNTEKDIKYLLHHSDSYAVIASTESVSQEDGVDLFDSLEKVIYMQEVESDDKRVLTTAKLEQMAAGVSDEVLSDYQSKVSYDDTLMFMYTSGTTGRSKAVMSLHYRVLSNVLTHTKIFGYNENDKIVSALPAYHVMGLLTSMFTFVAGGSFVIVKKFKTKEVLQTIQDYKCTAFHGVPTMYQFLLNYCKDYDISSLAKGMLAGAYCSPESFMNFQKGLHMKHIFCSYGQTEGIGYTQTRMGDSNYKRITTVGKAIDGVQIKVIDQNGDELPAGEVGEVIVHADYCMAGYYKNQEATDETLKDGWMYTGDLGSLDDEGYLTIRGRKKELIIRGGENISPVEIENTIRTYQMVQDVAVVGVPDQTLGEEICAYVTIKPGSSFVKTELEDYLVQNLAKFSRPKYLYVIHEMPLTASGKILKRELIRMFSEQTTAAQLA